MASAEADPPAPSRREGLAVAAATLLAAWLRGRDLAGYALRHWDEGLAWEGARWFASLGAEGHYSPTHAPPLAPLLFAAARLFGEGPGAAVWVSVLLATLSVPLIWWVGREAFSSATGVAAALLLAGSPLHAAYARSLLTESAYVFFLLLALGASLRWLNRGGPRWLFAAGLAAAALQATKYNGCLAAAPLGAYLLWTGVRGRAPWSAVAGRVALLAGPAALCIALDLAAIALVSGLGTFLEHYSGYVGERRASAAEVHRTLVWAGGHFGLGPLAPAALWLGYLGAASWLARRRRGPALLALALALYVAFLLRYAFFLRLALPVLTLLLLGLASLVDLFLRGPGPGRTRSVATLAGLVLAALHGWHGFRAGALGSFAGYPEAAREIEARGAPALLVAQDHVWPGLAGEHVVAGYPSRAAEEFLAGRAEVLLVCDIAAFSRLRPWDLTGALERLEREHAVLHLPAVHHVDALQNNLTLEELERLASDAELRRRVLSIHVLCVAPGALAEAAAGG